jgi:hypothetical protein
VVFFMYPQNLQARDSARFAEIAAGHGFLFVDLGAAFTRYVKQHGLPGLESFHPGPNDYHPNPEGHRENAQVHQPHVHAALEQSEGKRRRLGH